MRRRHSVTLLQAHFVFTTKYRRQSRPCSLAREIPASIVDCLAGEPTQGDFIPTCQGAAHRFGAFCIVEPLILCLFSRRCTHRGVKAIHRGTSHPRLALWAAPYIPARMGRGFTAHGLNPIKATCLAEIRVKSAAVKMLPSQEPCRFTSTSARAATTSWRHFRKSMLSHCGTAPLVVCLN